MHGAQVIQIFKFIQHIYSLYDWFVHVNHSHNNNNYLPLLKSRRVTGTGPYKLFLLRKIISIIN